MLRIRLGLRADAAAVTFLKERSTLLVRQW
jgi:hypothetical protein